MESASATITVMMTDLVGSTELLRHGAGAFDEIRRAHFAALRQVLAEHRGEEIKSMGDGVMATFTSAADAVACAAAVQQTIARLHRRDPRSPAVRVGLASGEATSEDGDWYGSPVIEAARLCAMAEGGQVLATAVVSLLLGGRRDHAFRSMGELQLKGFDELTSVVEVAWVPAADPDQLSLPPAAARAAEGFLVGREQELDGLLGTWESATHGRRALLLAGEPGVGKTRLAGELAATAHAEGAMVLWGRCDEEVGVAYQPFAEALGHWAEHRRAGDVAAGPELARLLPGLGMAVPEPEPTPGPGGDPEGQRLRLFDAVGRLLVDLGARQPLLIVLDDVHWATPPTLLLLRHLVRDPRPAPLLLVATYRDTDLDRTRDLAGVLADLRREPIVERRSIRGLDEAGVAAYLDAAASESLGAVGAELAATIHRDTEGNPFFVSQVLRHLVEVGALRQVDGRWTITTTIDDVGIPEGVREVIGRRLSRLSTSSNRALAAAAVVGRTFDLATLEGLPYAGEPAVLLDAVEEAVAARLVDEPGAPGRFTFSHALVRQTLLADLTAARRARLHRQAGEALAARPDAAPALVAHHLCSGITTDTAEAAVRWACLAMDDCWSRLEFEGSLTIGRQARRALDLLDQAVPAPRAELLTTLAWAVSYVGDIDEAKSLADDAIAAARAAEDAVLLGRAVNARVGWARAGVPEPAAGELLAEALGVLGDREPLLRARLLSDRALYLGINQNMGAAAVRDATAAVELMRESDDPALLLGALFVHGMVLQSSPDLEPQLALLEEFRRVEAMAPSATRAFALNRNRLEMVVAMQMGDRAGAEAVIAEVRATADRGGVGVFPGVLASMWQAMVALAEGRFDDAEAHAAVLLEMSAQDINVQNSWASLVFRIALERGRAADFVPLVREAVAQTPDLIGLQTALARALVATGELDEAREILVRLAADRFALVPHDLVLTGSLVQLTDTCLAVGDRAAAADLRELLLPYAGQLQVTAWGVHCLGAMDRYLGMTELLLDRADDADAHFASALALEESIGAVALATRTRLWWARLLSAPGARLDLRRAALLAAEAAQAARAIGQVEVAAAADALAAELPTPSDHRDPG